MDENKPKNYRLLRYPITFKDKKTGLDKTLLKSCGRAIDLGEKVMVVIDAMPTTTNKLFFFKKEEPSEQQEDMDEDYLKEEDIEPEFVGADRIDTKQTKLGDGREKGKQ